MQLSSHEAIEQPGGGLRGPGGWEAMGGVDGTGVVRAVRVGWCLEEGGEQDGVW